MGGLSGGGGREHGSGGRSGCCINEMNLMNFFMDHGYNYVYEKERPNLLGVMRVVKASVAAETASTALLARRTILIVNIYDVAAIKLSNVTEYCIAGREKLAIIGSLLEGSTVEMMSSSSGW